MTWLTPWRPPTRERNRRPATGHDVLTLSQIRHYVRLFWTVRAYGICGLIGGKRAFLRFVGEQYQAQVLAKIVSKKPISEYLSAPLQRVLSRKILQVLKGEVIFVEISGGQTTWKPMLKNPQPPLPFESAPPREHEFRIEHTVMGPKIRRVSTGY